MDEPSRAPVVAEDSMLRSYRWFHLASLAAAALAVLGCDETITVEPLDICRLRYLGGTTNHWAGYCHPFPVASFQKHDWMPNTGWPIAMDDVVDYYNRAIKLLELPDIPWAPVTGWALESAEGSSTR